MGIGQLGARAGGAGRARIEPLGKRMVALADLDRLYVDMVTASAGAVPPELTSAQQAVGALVDQEDTVIDDLQATLAAVSLACVMRAGAPGRSLTA